MNRIGRTLLAMLAALLLIAPGFISAAERTAAGGPPPVKPSIAAATVTDTVTQVIASEDLQRTALAHLEQAGGWRELDEQTTALAADFDTLAANASASADLIARIDLDRQLRELHRTATTDVDDLRAIAGRLEHDGNALDLDARKWQERRLFLEDQRVPATVVDRAQSMEAKLQSTSARLRDYRGSVLVALDRALALQVRIDDARARVAVERDQVRAQRIELEQSSLWQLGAAPAHFELVAAELHGAWRLLRDYLARNGAGLAALFFGVLALTLWLFARSGHEARSAERGYGRPVAASLLIALMALWWLAPEPPALFYGALLAVLPIPAALVAQRTFAAPIPLTLYGIALATLLLPVRNSIEASVIAARLLLLVQAICFAVPIAVDLAKGRLQQALPRLGRGTVRALALVVIAAALLTAFHAIFGFTGPARLVRTGMGSVLGFSLVFVATAVALNGAALALLSAPIVRWFRSARSADPALLRAVRFTLTALAAGGVVLVAMGTLGLGPTVRSAIDTLMGGTLEVGDVSIAGKAIVTALAVAIGTFVLMGSTGFILDREIVPRLQLRPGAGYAIVTFTRWVIVVVGAVLTLAALGIDMAKLTLLASAVGVGIGFGLQTIVNNFVSGLILIVERPVGVGDLIEVGPLLGEVKRIGIRSSIVRTGQGAEVIVPNAELVSKDVVNWTRSDRQRRYDIDVAVASGSEPERVMRLLVEAARDVPEVTTHPAPLAMFKGFSGSSQSFTLLAWVQSVDVGLQAQNALRVAILRKLGTAGIAVA